MDPNGQGGAVGKESINTEIITLTRFLNEEQTKHSEATGEFTYVKATSQTKRPLRHEHLASSATPSNSPSSR